MTTQLFIPPVAAKITDLTTFVNGVISDWVGAAPGSLDTLVDIANQFATDENVVTGLITTVAGKETKGKSFVSAQLFGDI